MGDIPVRLVLEDKGRIELGSAGPIPLPYRQVGLALALLADGAVLERDTMARAIWPNHPRAERLANLRQALMRLNQILGPGTIVSDRRNCRLAMSSKLELIGSPPSLAVGLQATSKEAKVLQCAPAEAVEKIICQGALCPDTAHGDLETLEASWIVPAGDKRSLAWKHYLRGYTKLAKGVSAALPSLMEATRLAAISGEWEAYSCASFWAGAGSILVGDLASAERIGMRVKSRLQSSAPAHLGNVENLLAHVSLHQGDFSGAADRLFWLSHSSHAREDERKLARALRTLYLAYDGRYREAEAQLEGIDLHSRTSVTRGYYRLAAAVIDTLSFSSASLCKVEELAEDYAGTGDSHYELYARELVVVRDAQRGRSLAGRSQVARIQTLRERLGMRYSAWDAHRLNFSNC